MGAKGGARRWSKKGCGVTVGEPSGDIAVTLVVDALRCIRGTRCSSSTGPARVHRLKEVFEVFWG